MKQAFIAIAITFFLTQGALAAGGTPKIQIAADPKTQDHMMSMDSKMETGVRVIDVVTESINGKTRYSPSVFIVKLGEKVKFKIFNATDKPHGFSIDAFKIKGELALKDNSIEFTADQEGLFDVYCQYHPAHLHGQLLVVK